jgi:uncharacterized protein (DUF1778 family)
MLLSYKKKGVNMRRSATSAVLSVRVSPDERLLLESAAGHAHTSLSDFIRRKAIDGAEAEMLERSSVTIPAADWDRFEAWVDAPAKNVPALRKLATHAPVWQN